MLQEIYFSDIDLSEMLSEDVRDYGMTHEQAHEIVNACEDDIEKFLNFLHYDMPFYPEEKLAQAAECFIEDICDVQETDRAISLLRDDRDLRAYAEDYALALEKLPRERTPEQLAEHYGIAWRIS